MSFILFIHKQSPVKPLREGSRMNMIQSNRLYLCVILVSMAGVMAMPATAEEQGMVIQPGYPVVPNLIGRIVSDPDRTYEDVRGPDDCSSESLYLTTKDMLAGYSINPTENSAALKAYILSGEAQCNCTAAIVGKDLDALLENVGSDISKTPCQ
jgi:hypothetical protein